MGEEVITKATEPTLFDAIRSLSSVTTEIEVKLFGKNSEESKESIAAENSIVRARNRITDCVETLRKANRALAKLDRK